MVLNKRGIYMQQTLQSNEILEKLLEKAKKTSFEFNTIPVEGYELVLHAKEKRSGLSAIIAIHNTSLGFALGGTRIQPYSSLEEALVDVLRLSKGMTYKSSTAQTGLGGGKSVIILDPDAKNKPDVLRAFGEVVNMLGGLYVCAEDMGCTVKDVAIIAEKTPFVTGLDHDKSSGNPSPFTAWGTFRGIQASLSHLYGSDSVEGKKVAIQGLGSVGMKLCEYLFWHGAELIVSDINEESLAQAKALYGALVVDTKKIYEAECDVFAPCAKGGILNDMTIPSLHPRCKIIAGAANNQLNCSLNADQLKKKGILYAPDFVINAGGLCNVTNEISKEGYNPKIARNKTDSIYNTLKDIYKIAKANNQSTDKAAIELAEYRVKYGIGRREEAPCFHHKN